MTDEQNIRSNAPHDMDRSTPTPLDDDDTNNHTNNFEQQQQQPEEEEDIVQCSTHPTTRVIPIHEDGWYLLCYGWPVPPTTPLSLANHNNNKSYFLSIQPPYNGFSHHDDKVIALRLPLTHERTQLEHHPSTLKGRRRKNDDTLQSPSHEDPIPLCDWNVGKLIYLSEGCELSVVALDGRNNDFMRPDPAQQRPDNNDDDEFEPQWCILRHPSPPTATAAALTRRRHMDDDSHFAAAAAAAVDPPPSVGTLLSLEATPKPLFCRLCLKSFSTVRGATSHVQEMHIKRQGRRQPEQYQQEDELQCPTSLKRSRDEIIELCGHCASNSKDPSGTGSSAIPFEPRGFGSPPDLYTRPLHVVFQDAHMAVVVKPQGMPVMGSKPSLLRSDLLMAVQCTPLEQTAVVNAGCSNGEEDSALGKPRPVHRLDSATGGLLVVAKTHRAETNLRVAFQNRACHKRYRAIVVGRLIPFAEKPAAISNNDVPSNATFSTEGDYSVINSPISEKESKTLFRVVRHVASSTMVKDGWLTVVDLWPVTGRKHQLRKHMKLIGHYILGDVRHCGMSKATMAALTNGNTVEGNNSARMQTTDSGGVTGEASKSPPLPVDIHSRLCLWAIEITLPHPMTGRDSTFQMEDPDWIEIVTLQEEELFKSKQILEN